MKTSGGLTGQQVKALARTEQPIFLIGASRYGRLDAAGAVHREMIGIDLNLESPHPDLSVLSTASADSAGGSRSIGIDAVKTFVDRLCRTPYAKSLRVGYIEPASALTLESQNALLHYIEEPTASSRVILSSRRSEDILPTLLSRCLPVRLPARAGDTGETKTLAEKFNESEPAVARLFDLMDDPDAAERILELRLAKPAFEVYDAVSAGAPPSRKSVDAFMEKRLPATESALLFVEIAISAAGNRLKTGAASDSSSFERSMLALIGKLLVLQMELRYNPQRSIVLAAVQEWLDQTGEDSHR